MISRCTLIFMSLSSFFSSEDIANKSIVCDKSVTVRSKRPHIVFVYAIHLVRISVLNNLSVAHCITARFGYILERWKNRVLKCAPHRRWIKFIMCQQLQLIQLSGVHFGLLVTSRDFWMSRLCSTKEINLYSSWSITWVLHSLRSQSAYATSAPLFSLACERILKFLFPQRRAARDELRTLIFLF